MFCVGFFLPFKYLLAIRIDKFYKNSMTKKTEPNKFNSYAHVTNIY